MASTLGLLSDELDRLEAEDVIERCGRATWSSGTFVIPKKNGKVRVIITGKHITDLFEQEWLRRYPRPGRVIYDHGIEFQTEYFHKICGR